MHISIATANFYALPFAQTLEIIQEAGFQYIELDLYWERGPWAMAQHLKGLQPFQVVGMIKRCGLIVSSIHDGGGLMDDDHSIQGFINPQLDEFLQRLGFAPGSIVFHAPHIEGSYGSSWWQGISEEIKNAAEAYIKNETLVTLENIATIDGFFVPLSMPQSLLEFVSLGKLGITLDTTHYAQMGIDVIQAAMLLREKIRTIHLSDYLNGKTHVFVGEGQLDFPGLFQVLDLSTLYAITLECAMDSPGKNLSEMTQSEIVDMVRLASQHLEGWVKTV